MTKISESSIQELGLGEGGKSAKKLSITEVLQKIGMMVVEGYWRQINIECGKRR